MKEIKEVSKDIECLLDKAEHFAKQAVLYKADFPTLSQRYANAANGMLEMMNGFHNDIVVIINDYKKSNGEPPAPMMAIYDYMHERFIEKAASVKNLLDLYKQ